MPAEPALLINGRFTLRRKTGVERYAHEMTRRMGGQARLLRPLLQLKGFTGHLWEQAVLPGQIKRGDLLWSPANSGPLSVKNQVVTIHDLAVLEHPEWFSPEFASWYKLFLPRLVRQVLLIITPSNFSRKRILEKFHLPEDKVVILPGGVDQSFFYPRSHIEKALVRKKYRIEGEYLLFVGSMEPRKNLSGLISAWGLISRQHPDIGLVIAGGENASFRKIKTGKLEGRIQLLGYVKDEDLPALYSGAVAYIQPSHYEGFGLCLLEAMACGVPLVSSQAEGLSELVYPDGISFDSSSIEDLAEKMSTILDDSALRHKLVSHGLHRAREYSWESSAAALKELLANVHSRSSLIRKLT